MRFDGDGTNFGSADDAVVVCNVVSARPQTVTVETGTDVAAVGECEKSRAIPRLHHASSPLVERLPGGIDRVVALPCLGNHQHDSLGKRENTVDEEQLKNVVKCSRIRSTVFDDGVEHFQLVTEKARLEQAFSCPHPVLVAS